MIAKRTLAALAAVSLLSLGLAGAPAVAAPPAAPAVVTTGIAPPPINAKGKALTGKAGQKGMPAKPGTVSTQLATGYHYAGGHEADVATGVTANIRVEKPFRNALGGNHTLMEMDVEKTIGGQRNIVEVGWTVDPGVNSTCTPNPACLADPHLFVFRWKAGSAGTYNGSGFVEYTTYCSTAGAICAGDNASAWIGTAKRFDIQYFNNAWWIGVNAQWIGWFPDSVWTTGSPVVTGFTDTDYIQGFGEVYNSASTRPCDDMGNGNPGSLGALPAAYVASVGYINQPVTNVNWVGFNTLAAEYSANQVSTRTVYIGGKGAAGTSGTTPGNLGSC